MSEKPRIKFYNTLTNKKEGFEEITGKKPGDTVLMYNCGPTVYSNAHIGNMSSYLMADLIRRFLEFKGYKVKQAKNITDVGHLVSDSDEGEDKLEMQAKKENKDPLEISEFYTKLYLEDEKKLNIKEAEERPKATQYIDEMIEMIKTLDEKGFVYEITDGLYFDVSKFKDYGKLSGNTLDKLKSGARVCVNEDKKSPADFALWKKLVGENKNHIMNWESPWGKGFPGWHIECSAMSRKLLGETIDIHTGGEDNIFPHHECEIAQSEGSSGKKFSHFWMHKRLMQVEGEKMSKSLGNFYTLKDLEDKGINPLDFRLLMMMSHYRTRTNFTFNGINAAKKFREKFNRFYSMLSEYSAELVSHDVEIMSKIEEDDFKKIKHDVDKALCEDLNTPEMFAVLNRMLAVTFQDVQRFELSRELAGKYKKYMEEVDKILGILEKPIPSYVQVTIDMRDDYRKNKNWEKSDECRNWLINEGYKVEDTSSGQIVTKI